MNNTDVEKLANEYIESNDSSGQMGEYDGFIAGFNAALEELQKEYAEVKNVYIGKGEISKEDYSYVDAGRFDILVKRKDLL